MTGPKGIDIEGPSARAAGAKLRVGFVLAQSFTLTAFSNFVDVLRLAADEGDRSRPIACAWHIMNAGKHPIRASCGLAVEPTCDLLDPEELDYVIVVGGLLTAAPSISD